ncbi:MAG: type transport system permease protein [Solirubrobacteraceae bacterium]|jgi:ABC-type transport system involved in multi-copper enzyme maturation permease subunit|nr:type transport system permease protein [Solirubrobacteraceae bacterium]
MRFSATLRSEWTKLVSLRSTKLLVGLAIVVSLLLTALLAIIVGETFDGWSIAAKRDFDPVDTAGVGAIVTAILFLVLGVKAATSEYGSGMIRLTLTATPQRWRVLAAKAAVVAAITCGAGLLSAVGMLLTATLIFGSYGLATPDLGGNAALTAILVGSVLAPQFPLIGMTLGLALRSTAAAIIATLGVLFAPPFIFALLPGSWQDAVKYFPGAASDGISGAADGLAPGLSALVVLAWLAAFLAVALVVFERRDA